MSDVNQLKIVNPLDYPEWDKLVLSTRGYSFFHSSAWARVLHESYGYKPLYFTLIDDGRLLILIPCMEVKSILTGIRGVSLPFSDYCEPLVNEANDLKEVFSSLIKLGKDAGWKSMEFRNGNSFDNEIPVAEYFGHTLELKGNTEQIYSGFRNSVKRNIKKGISEGVEVDISNTLESVGKFYSLNCKTRKRHGMPPQPYYFFKKVYEHIISQYHGFVALASYNKHVIAGAIYFCFGNQAIYKYGASGENYQNLRPNNIIMWKAIEWFSKHGFKSLSLGRTDPDNEGLRRYKKGWGTTETTIKYYKYDVVKGTFVHNSHQISQVQKKILSRLPQFVLRTTGCLLYRHIG